MDDGSPGRVIATMVGIVGILLLGSLFWSAVGSLFGALGQVGTFVQIERPTAIPFATATPAPRAAATQPSTPRPTVEATPRPAVESTPLPTSQPTLEPTAAPTQEAAARNPWILLPQPAPGSRVNAGQVVIEARGRGDAPITEIRLELDGAAVPATFEQRADTIWRGSASVKIGPGQHSARAIVVDERGKTGSFRWTFEATP